MTSSEGQSQGHSDFEAFFVQEHGIWYCKTIIGSHIQTKKIDLTPSDLEYYVQGHALRGLYLVK